MEELDVVVAQEAPPLSQEEPLIPSYKTTKGRHAIGFDNEELFDLYFEYNPQIINDIKECFVRSCRFINGDTGKHWRVHIKSAKKCRQFIQFLQKHGFEIDQEAWQNLHQQWDLANEDALDSIDIDFEPLSEIENERLLLLSKAEGSEFKLKPGFGGELRGFQLAGVEYASKVKRCFIADEMGLGKTVQALATVHQLDAFPVLIACPSSLCLNWKKEVARWLPDRTVRLLGTKDPYVEGADLYITSYNYGTKIKGIAIKAVIYDESHYLKNKKAQRTEAFLRLASQTHYRFLLSGTPMLNRPIELVSQLEILGQMKPVFGYDVWQGFIMKYCDPKKDRYGWNLSGASSLHLLQRKLRKNCFVRRMKSEVIADLPAKTRTEVLLGLSSSWKKKYDQAEQDLIAFVKEYSTQKQQFLNSIAHLSKKEKNRQILDRRRQAEEAAHRGKKLVLINILRQLAGEGKVDQGIEWLLTLLNDNDQKVVIFAHHIEVISSIYVALFKADISSVLLVGEQSKEERQKSVDEFQTDENIKAIVCSLGAGGVGHTLTAATNVVFFESGWNPAIQEQAEDRCHRIGQKNAVTAWYLNSGTSIENYMFDLINKKEHIISDATRTKSAANTNYQESFIELITK